MNGIQPGHPPPATMQMKGPNGAMGRAPDNGDRMNKNKRQLNTAIYDYFLKMGMYDLCRQLKQSGAPLELDDGKNGQKQEDDMQEGSDRPQDLPLPHIRWRSMGVDTAILLDWFSIFWDMWMVGANPTKMKQENPMALEYHTLLANQNKALHNQQQQLLMQRVGPMNPQMAMMRNQQRLAAGMVPNVQQQQLQMIKRHQAMQQQANMGRDGAGMDGDGQQPRTPGSGDNMPSPSKRQRIDGNPQFGPTGQMMQNGQGQQLEMRNMLQANGIHHQLTPNQITSLQSANQQRANMGGSPIVPPGVDQQMMGGPGGEFYNPRQLGGQANGHALQDYQMQLMLLERQNRKRLEMAKQEQHNMPVDGQPASGGSPMPDGMQRPSPSAMNYNGQMPGGMDKGMAMMPNGVRAGNPNFPNGMNPGMMPGAQPGGGPNQPQMNGANFPQGQQGPMGPGGQQGPQPMGTPQQRNQNMPPPPGMPPSNQHATGRAPSPAPSAANSTPQQSKAANPKKKNETKKDRKPSKAQQQKAAAAAATPAENQDNAPTTSTPATPMTPAMVNPNNKGGANANQGNGQNPSGPGQNNGGPGGPPGHQGDPNDAAAQNAANASASDPSFGIGLDEMDMTFGNVDAADVLENFNFDSYIEDPPQDFSIQGLDFGAFDNESVGA